MMAAIDPENFVAPPAKPRRRRSFSPGDFERLLTETIEMRDDGEFKTMKPKHFVALYSLLHEHVYGVRPGEVQQQFYAVLAAATRMLRADFNGDALALIKFMQWAWARERKREKDRDAENQFRIGWRLFFGSQIVTDYRVFSKRAAKRNR